MDQESGSHSDRDSEESQNKNGRRKILWRTDITVKNVRKMLKS